MSNLFLEQIPFDERMIFLFGFIKWRKKGITEDKT